MSQTKVLSMVAGMALAGVAFAGNDAELRADAAGRTSGLAPAAGYNAGFFEISDGGNNTLRIGGTITTRFNMSLRDEDTTGDQDDFFTGFNMPVTRLRMHGTIWDKALSYKIQGNFSDENPGGGTFGLEEAWGQYDFGNGLTVRWGQQNLALHREQLVDREFQQGMDRSATYTFFQSGYVQGVQLTWAADMVRVMGGVHDGIGSADSDFTSGAESDFGANLRVEVQAMGNDWNRWNDITSFRSAADMGLLIGAGVNYQTGGETGATTDVDSFDYTLDVSLEGQGWNVFAAGYGQHIDPNGADEVDNFGAEISAGFFFADQWEVFGRVDAIFLDDDVFGGDDDDLFFATLGVNYYMSPESHAVKFTAQAGYAFNDTTPIVPGFLGTNQQFLGDSEDGEIVFGLQGQIMF